MRFLLSRRLILTALLLLPGAWGCTGTPNGEGGLQLPSFGAPEQWEPKVAETPSTSDEDEL